jgi:hypothetical protein
MPSFLNLAFLKYAYTLNHKYTKHRSLILVAFPSSVGAIDQAQILSYPLIRPVNAIALLSYYSLEAYNIAIF